jgi:hypothetical protein
MKVYVAGKLNDTAIGYIKNVHKMMVCANKLRKKGHSVFVPCLDILLGFLDGGMEYSDYFENNIEWLKCADVVYVVDGGRLSSGTIQEVGLAKELGILVTYESEADLKYFEGDDFGRQ